MAKISLEASLLHTLAMLVGMSNPGKKLDLGRDSSYKHLRLRESFPHESQNILLSAVETGGDLKRSP